MTRVWASGDSLHERQLAKRATPNWDPNNASPMVKSVRGLNERPYRKDIIEKVYVFFFFLRFMTSLSGLWVSVVNDPLSLGG